MLLGVQPFYCTFEDRYGSFQVTYFSWEAVHIVGLCTHEFKCRLIKVSIRSV